MNPTFNAQVIADAQAEDSILARTEFGGQFREDLRQYLDDASIDRAVPIGVHERPPQANIDGGPVVYTAFADLSGGRHDAAALAIAHLHGDRPTLDCLRVIPAPHSPQEAIAQFAVPLKAYRLTNVTADGYAGNFATDEFARHGIACLRSPLDRSGIYLALLPHFTTGRVDLLDHARLIHE